MNEVIDLINFLLPFLSVILLTQGVIRAQNTYTRLAFCIACISFFLQIMASRGELLGPYFDSKNTIICTLDLFVMNSALLQGVRKMVSGSLKSYFGRLLVALFLLISLSLLFQLWTNAFFRLDRYPGTSILYVATFNSNQYCSNYFIFYKMNHKAEIQYLCSDSFGLWPKTGIVLRPPKFLLLEFAKQIRNQSLSPSTTRQISS